MAQTAFTVRMDSDTKKRFDEICKDFGMSSNTALNVFARTVVKQERIPFEVESQRVTENKEAAREFGDALEKLRAKVQAQGIPEMTLDEINALIKEVRDERRQKKEE
jgi:DNA-damage-inducible protein J